MARYQAILAYDGAAFQGFQRQLEARTVQATVETALSGLGWPGESILAAGRTDTGVHASGQVIAFDWDWRHGEQDLLKALNAALPADIAVRALDQAEAGFHPRFDAVARRYEYRLFCQAIRHPLRERYAWRVWPPASLDLMEPAAQHLCGSHDFIAFGAPTQPGGATIRMVFHAGWQSDGDILVFTISANAFLYHMIRRLVAFLVEIGQGRKTLDELLARLDDPKADPAVGLAPACGLVLAEVRFGTDELQENSNLGSDALDAS